MPLPIIATAANTGRVAATTGRVAATTGRSTATAGTNTKNLVQSVGEGAGKITEKGAGTSTTALNSIPTNISGNNVVQTPSVKPESKNTDKIIDTNIQEGNETQKAIENVTNEIKTEGNETQEILEGAKKEQSSSNESQGKLSSKDNSEQKEVNKINEKEKQVEEAQSNRDQKQDVRKAENQRDEIKNSIDNLCNCFKNGIGTKGQKSSEDGIFQKLLSFAPLLLPVLGPLLGLVAPLLPLLAAIATGVGLGAMLAKLLGGDNVFSNAYDGMKTFIETGSIDGDVKQRDRLFDQSLEADRRNARNNISDSALTGSKSNIMNQTAAYANPDLFGVKSEIGDTGEFKDLVEREEAFNVASNILSSFKNALDQYKGKARTTGGREVFSKFLKPYVLDVWPRYEITMKRAGLDPLKQAPGEFAEYAPALEVLYNDIKSNKSDAQVSRVAQTIAETGPKDWKSMGVAITNKEKVTALTNNSNQIGTTSENSEISTQQITTNSNNNEIKSNTENDNIVANPQDSEIKSDNTSSGGDVNVTIVGPPGQSSSGPKSTPAPSPEGPASRAPTDTIEDSGSLAFAVGKQTQHMTFTATAMA